MEDKNSSSDILGAGFEHVDIVLKEIGNVTPSDETLTDEDDQRILRKIDMWCASLCPGRWKLVDVK